MAHHHDGRTLFVGNLVYSATEAQLREIFSEAGPVASVKIVTDKDGQPRGFAFISYHDVNTAQSALRNLRGRALEGRTLRIDTSAKEGAGHAGGPSGPGGMGGGMGGWGGDGGDPRNRGRGGGGGGMASGPGSFGASSFGGRGGAMNDTGMSAQEAQSAITRLVQGLSLEELYALVANMQVTVKESREKVHEFLTANPQVAFALLQAQIMLGSVKGGTPGGPGGPGGPVPQMRSGLPMGAPGAPSGPPRMRPGGYGPPPGQQGGYGPPPGAGGPPGGGWGGPPSDPWGAPPPFNNGGMGPRGGPPPPGGPGGPGGPPPPGPGGPGGNDAGDQQALLAEIMNLTEEQIEALPADYKAQVKALRAQVGQ